MTEYPNREHENADKAARRRALKAVDEIAGECVLLRRKLEAGGNLDADDAQTVTHSLMRLTQNLSALEVLRDVREWHAADQAEAAAR
jgi:hypothetical protein